MSCSVPVVIVIEDEGHIRQFVKSALGKAGWRVFESETLARGLIDTETRKPDLIILDLGLPDGNGMDYLISIRAWSSVPVIVLSARVAEADKIKALDYGADDYLTKPFSVGELLARVRSCTRRYQQHQGADHIIEFGEIKVDLQMRQVTKSGMAVHLTPLEYRLLSVLILHVGNVVTITQLLREVWGPSHLESSHYVRIYMAHLRQKLEDDPTQPKHFLTEIAIGYRLVLS